jgi:hypothetical protein
MDDEKILEIRQALLDALQQADAATKPSIQQKLEELFALREDLHAANLAKRADALNSLSDILDGTIARIRNQIDNFLLTKLTSLKQEVDAAAGGGNPPPAAGGGGAAGGGPIGGGGGGGNPPAGPAPGGGPAPAAGASSIAVDLAALTAPHQRFANSVTWHLTATGLSISGNAPEGTGGQPQTVTRVWNDFGPAIEQSAEEFGVPVELIIATICTESSGNPDALRKEPGYVSDEATPGRVSPGLMQTLISTARDTLPGVAIDREWLFVPANSIRAGTAYISKQSGSTKLDPPVVACAYNAGSVKENTGADNRWKMRQFPIGTSEHANRFVQWFNDCFLVFAPPASAPAASFYRLLN